MHEEPFPSLIMMVELEDEEQTRPTVQSLIARAKTGHADAFEEIVIRHQRQIMRTAARMLGNIDDAGDAAQEVFLRLHKYLHRFDEEKEFLPWLYRMTVNVCKDIASKRRSASEVSLEHERDGILLVNLASPQDIEKEIGALQERKIIAEAIADLPEKERAAIVLRDIEGLDTKEAARILGSSEATVRSQISMARVKIKRHRDRVLNRLKIDNQ